MIILIAIRGATTVENDTKPEVLQETKDLLLLMMSENNVLIDDIISIIFTCTKDIKSVYPAVAAREVGITAAGLMCMAELDIANSLSNCIRVMMNVNTNKVQKEAKHIYLKKAKILRPDIKC